MKKLTAFLFAVMSIFVLAGCNSQSEEEKQDGTTDVKGGEPEFGWNVNPDSLPVVYRAFFVRDEKRWLETITFEDNGTFELYAEGISLYQGELERLTEDEQKKIIQELTKSDCKYTYVGTYTGDATKSGEICLSFKEKEGSSYNANQINLDGAVWNINIEYCNWFILPEEKADENRVINFYRIGYWKYGHDIVFELEKQSDQKEDLFSTITFKEDGTFLYMEQDGDTIGKCYGYYHGNAAAYTGSAGFEEYGSYLALCFTNEEWNENNTVRRSGSDLIIDLIIKDGKISWFGTNLTRKY